MTRGRGSGASAGSARAGGRGWEGSREPAGGGSAAPGGGWTRGPHPPGGRWLSPGGFGVESAPGSWGKKSPQTAGRGVPGTRRGKTFAKSCCVFSLKLAASLLPGGRRGRHGGGRGAGSGALDGVGGGDNCARAFAALPRPPVRVSRHRGLQRARQPRRSAGSSNSWTGSGWTEPEAPGPEGTAGGLPGAGCVFPRVRGFVLREVAPGLHSGGGLGGGRQPAPGTLWVSVGHGCRPAD